MIKVRRQEDKRNGRTYIYSSVDSWSPEKKRSESKRRIIGRLDPEDNTRVLGTKKNKGAVIGRFDPVNFLFYPNEPDPEVTQKEMTVDEFILKELRNNGLSPEQQEAFDLLLNPSCKSVCISGSGGAGKTSILVRAYMALRLQKKKVLSLAYTGNAADNINDKYRDLIQELRNSDRKKFFPRILDNEKPSKRTHHSSVLATEPPKAKTIHSGLMIDVEKWYDPKNPLNSIRDEVAERIHKDRCNNIIWIRKTINEKYKERAHNKTEAITEEIKQEIIDSILSQYDVIIIDEVSMVSSNLMDIILQLKETTKREIRMLYFGDFYQMKPYISKKGNDAYEKLLKNYKKYYHGGVSPFCCDRLSRKKNKGKVNSNPTTLFFELKENHRIDVGPEIDPKSLRYRNNMSYIKHLEQIKLAGDTLYSFVVEKKHSSKKEDLEKLLPLHEAICFFNKRCKYASRFRKLKSVEKLMNQEGIFPVSIHGLNRSRLLENRHREEESRIETTNPVKYRYGLFPNGSAYAFLFGSEPRFRFKSPRFYEYSVRSYFPAREKEYATFNTFSEETREYLENVNILDWICKENNILPEYSFHIGMPVSFIKTVTCAVRKPKDYCRFKDGQDAEVRKATEHFKCVNGKSAIVSDFGYDENGRPESIYVKLENHRGKTIEVGPITLVSYYWHGAIEYRRPPIEPAYAFTYNKIQGQSLDSVYVKTAPRDLQDSSSLYVGLSRGRDYSCLAISRKIPEPLEISPKDKTIKLKETNGKLNIDILFSDYFKLDENANIENTNRFFLEDIKKEHPKVYDNWEYRTHGEIFQRLHPTSTVSFQRKDSVLHEES